MSQQKNSVNLNVRVTQETVDTVDELTETHGDRTQESYYYKKDIVAMALKFFSKTLKERKVKPGDDIEKKLKL